MAGRRKFLKRNWAKRNWAWGAIPSGLVGILAIGSIALAASSSVQLPFTAIRNGSKLGVHTITIARDGDRTEVKIATRFKLDIAFVTVYRFEHDSVEIWQKDHLFSLQAKTNDNGTHYQLSVHAADGQLVVDGTKDGKAFTKTLPDMPSASLWSRMTAHGTAVLNTVNGSADQIIIADLGQNKTIARGANVAADHIRVSGALTQDDWYDTDGNLIRKIAKGPDGSDVDFNLQ